MTGPDTNERRDEPRAERPKPTIPLVRVDAPTSHDGPRLDRRALIAAGGAAAAAAATMPAMLRAGATPAAPGVLNEAGAQEATPGPGPSNPDEAANQVAAVQGTPQAGSSGAVPVHGGYQFLQPFHVAILEAATSRLIPSDDLGPGAAEADVPLFIDRQLYIERMAWRGYRGPKYDLGPFQAGDVTQGDQSALPTGERFRLGLYGMEGVAQRRFGTGFAQLSADDQDAILADMESGKPEDFGSPTLTAPPADFSGDVLPGTAPIGAKAFFDLLLAYTVAGFFVDPVHGGNRDMAGWKLIGFPGAQMGYPDWILRYGEPFDGGYLSLAEHQAQMSHEGA